MKHKVGDTVTIKSLDWYNENKLWGRIRKSDGHSFVYDMSEYCGMKAKIAFVLDDYYFIDIDNGEWTWCDYMFEDGIRFIKKKNITEPIVINKDYVLSDRLTSIEELDELEKDKECIAWYNSDTSIYTIWSAFLVKDWSYRILKKELNNIYKVIRNDNANIIVEELAKENIIHGENVKKAIDITRKILNKNE